MRTVLVGTGAMPCGIAERHSLIRMPASPGAFAGRDNLSNETAGMIWTCCALGEQDAILGHVASRGDRKSPMHRIEAREAKLSTRVRPGDPRSRSGLVTKISPIDWN